MLSSSELVTTPSFNCPQIDKLVVQGTTDSEVFSFIRVYVEACANEEFCTSDSEINKAVLEWKTLY